MNFRRSLPAPWHLTQWTPNAPIGVTCTHTLDRKKGRSIPVTVLEAAFDLPCITELYVVDYHLRDEVTALFITHGSEAVVGDDGLRGRDAQNHRAFQSPHDELPALRDGAVEASLWALQRRDILGTLYDFITGSTS